MGLVAPLGGGTDNQETRMHENRTIRLAGAVAFAAVLVLATLATPAGADPNPENNDPLGLIADGGLNCEAAAGAYVMAGWNLIDGNNMPNNIVGGNGPDFIRAWGGNDTIDGRGGPDIICAGAGDDWAEGSDGNDFIYGEWGQDQLLGEAGNDHLDGGPQVDMCNGGAGANTAFSCP
jgi:Ca2+-binding RTX toxin-like protein